MTYTVEQYNALNAAIVAGELSVRHGDRSVTYRSIDEMLKIKRLMEQALGLNNDPHRGRRLASFSKGY